MLTEFVSLQLTREELQTLHAALIQRAMLEDELRAVDGKPSIELPELLAKLEMLLGERDETLHKLVHDLHNSLWEYAWSVFTDEWAHFRAHQDVNRELQQNTRRLAASAIEKLVEMQYRKHGDRYVAELDMDETKKITKPALEAQKRPTRRA